MTTIFASKEELDKYGESLAIYLDENIQKIVTDFKAHFDKTKILPQSEIRKMFNSIRRYSNDYNEKRSTMTHKSVREVWKRFIDTDFYKNLPEQKRYNKRQLKSVAINSTKKYKVKNRHTKQPKKAVNKNNTPKYKLWKNPITNNYLQLFELEKT